MKRTKFGAVVSLATAALMMLLPTSASALGPAKSAAVHPGVQTYKPSLVGAVLGA